MCEDLQLKGCDVRVVTAFPHYAQSVKPFQKSGRLFEEEKRNGLRILRIYVYTVSKGALWRRLLYHASFNIFSALAALRVGKPDIVIADAPTLWSGLPLLISAIFRKVPFVYVIHDIYPDVLFRLGILKNSRIIKMVEQVERFFYNKSAQISVLSDGFKENLVRKGVNESKIAIIPACVDVEFVQPLQQENKLSKRWNLDNKFVVLYAGNLGFSQDLSTALEAAQLLSHIPDIMFVFVGEGATKNALQAMADKNRLSNVKFFPFQPREDVPFIYALADLCIVSLKRDIIVESVPSKMYTIMASGRPVVATADQNSEVGLLLNQAQCGFCIESENSNILAQAILRLYEDDSLRNDMGARGREFVVKHYSRLVAANQYHELIQNFVGKELK